MKVLVDTSVWSLALRRRARPDAPEAQELLSGIRMSESFERLRDHLRHFPDEPLAAADFERAAEHFNKCLALGVRGSNTDFLICAVGERRNLPILTTDADFVRFAAVLPITLHGRKPA
ncbi:MAG: PIN domain nuclease [Vicinamibacterales bacterium]